MPRGDTYIKRLQAGIYYGPGQCEKREQERISSASLPLTIHPYELRHHIEVKLYPGGTCTQIQHAAESNSAAYPQIKPRSLRMAFQQVDTPSKLSDFLRLCGPFRDPFVAGAQQRIEWPEFLQWQAFMRDLQRGLVPVNYPDLKQALQDQLMYMVIERQAFHVCSQTRGKFFECAPDTALTTIAATISADELAGLPIRQCDGCINVFPVESMHERESSFCSPMCQKRHWKRQNAARKTGGQDEDAA